MDGVQSFPEKVLVDQLDPPYVSAEPPSVSGTVGQVVLVQSSCQLRQKILLCILGILGFKKWLLPTAATQDVEVIQQLWTVAQLCLTP